jgi:methionyl aminopeptidase
MIKLKSDIQIEKMGKSGKLASRAMADVFESVAPGISTKELDKIAYNTIVKNGGKPAFKGYRGFPATICASLNEAVVHGIPSAKHVLHEGDIVSVDLGVVLDGYHSDLARTFMVGTVSEEVKDLVEVTKQSFFEGLKGFVIGNRLMDISKRIQAYAQDAGYSVVRDLVGHGIGVDLHEAPDVPNFVFKGPNPRLNAGLVLAIEPMINMGVKEVDFGSDGWTVTTRDKKPSAHYENTVALMADGIKILTDQYI